MPDFLVRCTKRDGITETEVLPETDAREEGINQYGSMAADLESDGYVIRYIQIVLDHPNGDSAVIDLEPA